MSEEQAPVPVAATEESAATEAGTGKQQFLTFDVAGRTYGVDILGIREIIEHDSLTRVPMTPSYIRGVMNLRGSVVPIIDLAVRLGNASEAVGRRSCNILVEVEGEDETVKVGFLVNLVHEVLTLAAGDIEAAPTFGSEVRPDFIAGMGRTDNGFVTLLDLDTVLSVRELARFREAGGQMQELANGSPQQHQHPEADQ